jgi:hypothetical protein
MWHLEKLYEKRRMVDINGHLNRGLRKLWVYLEINRLDGYL